MHNTLHVAIDFSGLPNDDAIFKKPYEIQHTNTRFQKDPFEDALDRSKLVEAAAENAKFNVGERVGHDGKAILPSASPSVNGYGFVATPSPAPGRFKHIWSSSISQSYCPDLAAKLSF